MPLYEPSHIEYTIDSGYIQVNLYNGENFPAYWAYPQLGGKFPAIALLHDWWGINTMVRRLANGFAQSGYYVIVPDLFDGQTATTPKEAIALVEALGERTGLQRIYAAIDVVESHHQTNRTTAAVGLGMGGSFAFDMAISRDDIEAAVAFAGFPQRNFGQFRQAKIPILALYGSHEPHVSTKVIDRLKQELNDSSIASGHEVAVIDGLAHEFFSEQFDSAQTLKSSQALKVALQFLEKHLKPPSQRPQQKVF
jgi:carboxymethylenebutenolidase